MPRREEQRRRVDQAPVGAPNGTLDLEIGEEAVDRRAELIAEAGHRPVDLVERPAELVGQTPVRREANHAGDQPIAGPTPAHQTEVLLDEAAGELERSFAPGLELEVEPLAGGQVLDCRRTSAVDLREARREMIEQQRQHLGLPDPTLRQAQADRLPPLLDQSPSLRQLAAEAGVDLDPVPQIERLQAHREPPRAVEERAVTCHNRPRIRLKITPI
jgi:hypothetical protein